MEPVEGLEPPVFVYRFTKAVLSPLSHTGKKISGWRESNPHENLGKVPGYHYITPAIKYTLLCFQTHRFTVVVSVIQAHFLKGLY